MDTYASAAGDPNGFYNIRALAPALTDSFHGLPTESSGNRVRYVSAHQFLFSEKTAIDQYVAAGAGGQGHSRMPFFGIDWPTSDGTLTAQATGRRRRHIRSHSSGHPVYWDATTKLRGRRTRWAPNGTSPSLKCQFALRRSAVGSIQRTRRNGDLGSRHGWQRPGALVGAPGIFASVKDYSPVRRQLRHRPLPPRPRRPRRRRPARNVEFDEFDVDFVDLLNAHTRINNDRQILSDSSPAQSTTTTSSDQPPRQPPRGTPPDECHLDLLVFTGSPGLGVKNTATTTLIRTTGRLGKSLVPSRTLFDPVDKITIGSLKSDAFEDLVR